MGLFSNRKVNVVSSSVARVIPDEFLPNSAVTGTLNAVFRNESISESINKQILNGIGIKANRLYKFGQTKYVHGLPSGVMQSASQGLKEAKEVIETIEGKEVLIQYSRVGAPNLLHQGWAALLKNHGYDVATNTLQGLAVDHGWGPVPIPITFDTKVYLDDMHVVVNDLDDLPEMTEMWGIPPTAGYTPERPLNEDGSFDPMATYSPIIRGGFDGVRITYRWRVLSNHINNVDSGDLAEVIQTSISTFDIPATANQDKDYIHVKYEVAGTTKYWMYELGSGTYPVLDSLIDAPAVSSGTYFPFLYFRYGKKRLDDDKTTKEYKDSKKFAKYLGMDFADTVDLIHDTEGRDQKQVDDLESAMLFMAIPANSKNATDLIYLWAFMDNWFYQSEGKYMDPSIDFPRLMPNQVYAYDSEGTPITKTAIIIEDKKFKMVLNNGGMYKKLIAKQIGPVGSIEPDTGKTWTERNVRLGSSPDDYHIGKERVEVMTHIYRKQVSINYCEEIHILSMKMLYYVWGNYTAMANDDEDILMIPIDKAITDNLNTLKKEELYGRSLHFLFNSRMILTIKWYQTTFFSVIITLIVAIISVFIGFSDGGSLFAAAIAGSTVAAAIIVQALVLSLLTSMAVQIGFTAVAEALGVNASVFLAVVALIVGSYGQISSMASGVASAPWANTLLQVASGLQEGIQGAMTTVLEDMATDLETYRLGYEEDMDALAAVNRELAGGMNRISPFVVFGESPDDFYNRTIHAGNIGVQGIDMVANYVENSLRLPTFTQTIENPNYLIL